MIKDVTAHEKLVRQLELSLNNPPATSGERIDISFLHRSFCVAGLPIKQRAGNHFARNDGTFSINVTVPEQTLPDGTSLMVGVPYGPKARLLILWMTTQARDPLRSSGDRWLEIGRIEDWLRGVGINAKGEGAAKAKDQLVRLTFSLFSMFLKGENLDLFKSDKLIESAAFGTGDLEQYATGQLGKVRWPLGLELTQRAYDRFTSRDSIPIPTSRLAEVSHSAMAIDLFVYLCYRLPEITPGDSQLTRWKSLVAQFGNKESPSKFRETFEASIRSALRAYPEANVELTDEGLLMRYSDPAELKRAFITVATPNGPERHRRALRNRTDVWRPATPQLAAPRLVTS
ncbi:MAG: replication protein RepA [Azospirillaceae bacterium]|nr:replication protein RepA [Azospirillaceae bacterium]